MSQPRLAIVGLAAIYPDAHSPAELWENMLAQRRAFRTLPDERLRLADYYDADTSAPDKTYSTQASVLSGYQFDRLGFKISGSTFRATDMTHWLALDVARRAFEDAGLLAMGERWNRSLTGVYLGNTLTGEFSRASLMRYRWPYVRRTVDAALLDAGFSAAARSAWLEQLEVRYKAPFAPIGEDSLAGGLANTIAGRVCNTFDLQGGGFTVDGACSSSLLAVSQGCQALVNGDVEVALVGGVDLSLDPFELLGFAKTGALAHDEMRVYDERSAGFWPGEGCGMLVLTTEEHAKEQGLRTYALIRGWGVSSDGQGGITRPEVRGQRLAFQRAYRRAGFGADSVTYFEGHGTGTAVGDTTELSTLIEQCQEAGGSAQEPAFLGSAKALIGHCKGAAGVAGLIKATLAVHHQLIPPTVGAERPHRLLQGKNSPIQLARGGRLWPAHRPLRAAVSSMGFGGINTHVVLEGATSVRRKKLLPRETRLLRSAQDAELFLFGAPDREHLLAQLRQLLVFAPRLSRAELGDLAATLQQSRARQDRVRASLVASTAEQLTTRLKRLQSWLEQGLSEAQDDGQQTFLGTQKSTGKLGLLFPGQAAPVYLEGGALARRFEGVAQLYQEAQLPVGGDTLSTAVAQPAILTATLAGLQLLELLQVEASLGLGHSLGELAALHWAGALSREQVLALGRTRGDVMARLGHPEGAMLSVSASPESLQPLLEGLEVTVSCFNGPEKTVLAGNQDALAVVEARLKARGLGGVRLPVSRAFHSPLMQEAVAPFAQALATFTPAPLEKNLYSTVTGGLLQPSESSAERLRKLLAEQLVKPVQFTQAIEAAGTELALWIEVGPGRILGGLTTQRVISLDAGGPSMRGLLHAVAALYALGLPVETAPLFEGRFVRPFRLDWQPEFLVNPCELAPFLPEGVEPGHAREMALSNGVTKETQPVVTQPVVTQPTQPVVTQPALSELGRLEGMGVVSQAPNPPGSPENSVKQDIATPHGLALTTTPTELANLGDPAEPGVGLPQVLALVREKVAARAELPLASIANDARLLIDLHLNSLTVSQIVSQVSRQLELLPPASSSVFAHATVEEVAQALMLLVEQKSSGTQTPAGPPDGLESWVRPFELHWIARTLKARPSSAEPRRWSLLDLGLNTPWASRLAEDISSVAGHGWVIGLPPQPSTELAQKLLQVLQQGLSQGIKALVLVQTSPVGGSLLRTLHLEQPQVATRIISVMPEAEQPLTRILAELEGMAGHVEVRLEKEGRRLERSLKRLSLESATDARGLALNEQDVVLVTGGGKGLTAECALRLAQKTGAKLALIGRSVPEKDETLRQNLARFAAAGTSFQYYPADLTGEGLEALVAQVQQSQGPITGILHGAARNEPTALPNLSAQALKLTLEPKVQALDRLLACVPSGQLKLLIGLGSIIGVAGLWGEGDYALANEWMTWRLSQYQAQHPTCVTLALEWSVWSGTGMGERLGQLELLQRQGISPIPLSEGLHLFEQLVEARASGQVPLSVVGAGRLGHLPTLKLETPEVPFLRFLERVPVFYPGIELVAEAELTPQSDPYLADHRFRGDCLFPAVMGLEAMTQAAQTVLGRQQGPVGAGRGVVLEDFHFARPLVINGPHPVTLRVVALVRGPETVEVALRSSETGFVVDHFRGKVSLRTMEQGGQTPAGLIPAGLISAELEELVQQGQALPPLQVDTKAFYEAFLFHEGRFRRVEDYRVLRARQSVFSLLPPEGVSLQQKLTENRGWFDRILPPTRLLGDPGQRDATLHGLQGSIPQLPLLPVKVERLTVLDTQPHYPLQVYAQELRQEGLIFTWEAVVVDAQGKLCERWEGLQMQGVAGAEFQGHWPEPFIGPWLERRLEQLRPEAAPTVLVQGTAAEPPGARTAALIAQHTGQTLLRRPDGAPELPGLHVSASHREGLSLALLSPQALACDVETVAELGVEDWQGVLSENRRALAEELARVTLESPLQAACRVWSAQECLVKVGASLETPLTLDQQLDSGEVLLKAGPHRIYSQPIQVVGQTSKLLVSVLL
ncbi:MAG: type I polyketide synthase [Myxococcota bacterium]